MLRAKKVFATMTATAALCGGMALPAQGQPPEQSGLVNVNVEDVTLLVPIGVAANVCNLDVAVLAELTDDEAAPCDATVEQFPRPFRQPQS
jgi:hypothetical protein